MLEYKWAQQQYLPGFEGEKEEEEFRLPTQTKLEENIDIQQQVEPRKRWEGWVQLPFEQYPPSDRPKMVRPESDLEESDRIRAIRPTGKYRIPHPSKFPDLDENNIGMMFLTREYIESKEYSTKDGPKKLSNILDPQQYATAKDTLKIYNDFKEIYKKYYEANHSAGDLVRDVSEYAEIKQNSLNLPLKNFLLNLPDIIKNEVKVSTAHLFQLADVDVIDIFVGGKILFADKIKRLVYKLHEVLQKYYTSLQLIEDLSTKARTHILNWLDVPQNRKFVELNKDNREEKEIILKKIVDSVYYHRYSNFGRFINSVLSGLAIDNDMDLGHKATSPISALKSETAWAIERTFIETFNHLKDNVVAQLNDEINYVFKNEQDVHSRYDKIKPVLSKYVDLDKLEKLFNFGIFSKGNKVGDNDKLKFKYDIIQAIRTIPNRIQSRMAPRNEKEFNQLIYRKDKKKKIEEIAKRDLNKIITNTILNSLQHAGDNQLIGISRAQHNFGDFSPKVVIPHFVNIVENLGIPKENALTFAKYALKRGHYNLIVPEDKKTLPDWEEIALHFVKRKNQLSPEKMLEAVLALQKWPVKIQSIYYNVPNKIKRNNSNEILSYGIRSIDTIKQDLQNIESVITYVHNDASNIQPHILKQLLINKNISFNQSRDIAKKFNKLIIRILGEGGIKKFKEKYGNVIKLAQEKDVVGKDFDKNLKLVGRLYLDNKEINPSKPNFQEIKNLVLKTSSEVEVIMQYREFAKYYEQSQPKDENLFKLDLQISPILRFRVLRDRDPQYFQVGNETDCCQSPGGVGEEAMIDSFINKYAAVIVLETLDNGWETVGQSYFHWVPEDQGYILDNVELNPNYEGATFNGLTIEQLYFYWAKEKKKELNLPEEKGKGYILAGRGYSDIDTSEFNHMELDRDPREFAVEDPYTDWSANGSLDLTSPRFEMPALKTAMYRLAAQLQENLKEYLSNNPQQYQRMENIEEESFEKYEDDYGQDAEDIEDDFNQPGAMGVGVTDNSNNLAGYIYGYNMTEDELPEVDLNLSNIELVEQYGVRFYSNVPEGFVRSLYQEINQGKVFYVANLALPEYKIKLYRMIKDLLGKLKAAGYQYITFDALSDTMKLFLGEANTPKSNRLSMFGVELIAIIPSEDEAQALVRI